jgi:hypothetical protein
MRKLTIPLAVATVTLFAGVRIPGHAGGRAGRRPTAARGGAGAGVASGRGRTDRAPSRGESIVALSVPRGATPLAAPCGASASG